MATAFTNSDSLGFYLSGLESDTAIQAPDSSIGGVRLSLECGNLGYIVTNPIPQIIVDRIIGINGSGTAYIKVKSTTELSYTAPGDTEGATTTVADGTTILLQSGTTSKAIRVTRNGSATFVNPGYGVQMTLNIQYSFNNVPGMSNVTNAQRVAGVSTYRAMFARNESALSVSSIALYARALVSSSQTTNSAQLGGAGSGTITTTGSFAAWPSAGWAEIFTAGLAAQKEIVYYTSRTATSLTVPAAGRGLLGTTAAAGAGTDVIYAHPGIRVGMETPAADGSIQRVADENTAPTGVTWYSSTKAALGLSVGTLTTGQSTGIWIHREVPAGATLNIAAQTSLVVVYTYSATTYTGRMDGLFRIANTAIALYELYVASGGTSPDLTAAATATSATLPFSYALTPPGSGSLEYRYTVLKRNEYNLVSLNQYCRSVTISSTGADVTPELSVPTSQALVDQSGGYATVGAVYTSVADVDPADYWALYVSTDGTDPDPSIDTPTLVSMTNTLNGYGFATRRYNLAARTESKIGPYSWGTDLRVLVRSRRSSDSAESANTTTLTLTVGTTPPIRVNKRITFLNSVNDQSMAIQAIGSIYYVHQANNIRFIMLNGETLFYGGTTEIWRIACPDTGRASVYVPSGWAFVNDATAWGAGTATAYNIEMAAWGGGSDLLYVIVNGTRRVKIDVTNLTISADTFSWYGTLTDCPVENATVGLSTETLFQVWNNVLGRWTPGISVSSSGVLTTASSVIQNRGN